MTYNQKEGQSFDEFLTQLKKFSSDCEFGELKQSLIKDIVVIGVTDDSEKAIALGQFAKQTKIPTKELKQEAGIYGIKSDKKKNKYLCKYCGRTHMRGACPVCHQTYKKLS